MFSWWKSLKHDLCCVNLQPRSYNVFLVPDLSDLFEATRLDAPKIAEADIFKVRTIARFLI